MKDILDELDIILKTLIITTKTLYNYAGDRGVNPTRRNEIRDNQEKIKKAIKAFHDARNKLQEKDN